MNNPELLAWYQTLSDQHAGKAALFLLIAGLFAYALAMRSSYPVFVRLIPGAAYVLALVLFVGHVLFVIAPALLIAGVLFVWKQHILKIPPICLILALAVILRIPMLFQSLWYDETFTAAVSKLPLDRMWTVILSDVHPPLFYWLTHIFTGLAGRSEIAFRMLPAVFGVLAVYLVYRLYPLISPGKQARRGALVAAGLTAVMPAFLFHSNDARGYTLLLCAVLVMLIAALEDRPLWFAGAATIAILTHNLMVVYVGFIGIWVIFVYREWHWLTGFILPGLMFLWWLPIMLAQSHDISDGFWIEPLSAGKLITPLFYMLFGERYPSQFQAFSGIAVFVTTLAALSWAVKYWFLDRRQVIGASLWLTAFAGTPLALAIVSVFWSNVYLERAMLPSAALLIILTARFLTEGQRGDVRGVLLFFAPALLIVVCWYLQPEFNRTDTRQKLANACQGFPAWTTSIGMAIVGDYYLSEPPILWQHAGDMNQWLSPAAKQAMGWQQAGLETLPPGKYCILDAHNALNRADERDYMAQLLSMYPPVISQSVTKTDTYGIRAHIVEVR